MHPSKASGILVENDIINSKYLGREVKVDFYLPRIVAEPGKMSLLLINDGQDMEKLGLEAILNELFFEQSIRPVLCVGIHASKDRRREYGVAAHPDYLGRGDKAVMYTSFIMDELLPYIHSTYKVDEFHEKAFAGFSLGGLTALDIAWNKRGEFARVGVFSGSLWWRSLDQNDEAYQDDLHRIMHQQVRNGKFQPGLKFFFQCGNMDETMDRNNNGIIDSIDDTLDLIRELETKGYSRDRDIYYLEFPDGHHDVPTWARAMPVFLKWSFSR